MKFFHGVLAFLKQMLLWYMHSVFQINLMPSVTNWYFYASWLSLKSISIYQLLALLIGSGPCPLNTLETEKTVFKKMLHYLLLWSCVSIENALLMVQEVQLKIKMNKN